MVKRGKRHVFYRMMLRRIIAWMILCLMLSFAFISFFPITALADGEGFNMQFSQTIVYNQEDIWSNGTGSGRHYFAIWEKGPYLFLNNDLIEAEVIHVSKNDAGYQFSLPAVNFDEMTGDPELYYLENIQMGSMTFTCREPKFLTEDECYTDDVVAFNFMLDNPVRIYQKREVYYSDDRYQCTYEYELNLEEFRVTILMGTIDGELQADTAQYMLDFKGTSRFINTDMGTDETKPVGEDFEAEPSYYSFNWTYTDRPVKVTDLGVSSASTSEPKDEEITQKASETEGETGTDISSEIVEGKDNGKDKSKDEKGKLSLPGAIVVGVGAGAAGAAGAAAAGSALKGDPKEAEEEKKRYRMYVGKDFGDTIRKGAAPVVVRARIAEIGRDNVEKYRPDLSERISVMGNGINLASARVNGYYLEAYVYVDENSTLNEGTLTFTYAGEGGTFKNNIIFKLAGKPYLRFPEFTAGGTTWVLNADKYVDMIAGDDKTYPVMFYFEDAVSRPKTIRFNNDTTFDVSVRDAERINTYYADIVNHSSVQDENGFSFPSLTEKTVHIYAEFDNGDTAEGDINIRIYPEGLFIKASQDRIENERLLINAYEDKIFYGDDVEPTPRFIPTRLNIMLALSTDEGAEVIDGDKAGVKIGSFIGEEGPGMGLAEKLECEISNVGSQYSIVSKKAFVEGDKPFYMQLPVSCEYQGRSYERNIPVRVIGAKPEPMQDWEKEYRKVLYAIKRYIEDGERRAYWVMLLKEHKDSGRFSAYTLRMMWWSIYYEYYDYEISVGAGYNFQAEAVDWMVSGLEWTKWVCGVTFSYCADGVAGNPLGGALIQMAYEFVMDGIEELMDCMINNREFKPENLNGYKHLMDAGDNAAGGLIKDSLTDTFKGGFTGTAQLKKAATYIGAYMGYLVYKNLNAIYNEKGEWDLPGAIFATFKDMTVNLFKTIGSELFGNWLKSKKFQTEAGKIVSDAAKKVFEQYRTLRPVDTADLAAKFVEEAIAGGTGFLVDWAKGKYETTEFNIRDDNHVVIIFRLWEREGREPVCCGIDLTRSLTYIGSGMFSPFVVIYDMLFGNLVGAQGTISFPRDPKAVRRERIRDRARSWDLDLKSDQA